MWMSLIKNRTACIHLILWHDKKIVNFGTYE